MLYANWNNGERTNTTYDDNPAYLEGKLWETTNTTLHKVTVTSDAIHTNILGTASISGS
jgi:hypothetical protein